jgi:hypothetical protein
MFMTLLFTGGMGYGAIHQLHCLSCPPSHATSIILKQLPYSLTVYRLITHFSIPAAPNEGRQAQAQQAACKAALTHKAFKVMEGRISIHTHMHTLPLLL